MRFDELNLEEALLEGLSAMNFKETTPVQEQTIPHIINREDMLACAQTGTGKTAAYLLPILNILCKEEHDNTKTQAVVMVPTRELAQQIDKQLEAFAYFLPISSVAVYGGGDGATFGQQDRALQSGVDIVIATPGRLISLLNMGRINLKQVQFFILDEADRMLEMGFIDDIMLISSFLPKKKQTLLFSATMAPKIQQLARKILVNPTEIKLSTSKPAEKIKQSAYICYENQKLAIIQNVFDETKLERVIVFSSSKQKVKDIHASFLKKKFKSAAMHSDLSQKEREDAIHNFKNGTVEVLVATDIVARGIDIEDIEMVINYDVPHDVEDYVHRIGRTARANSDGAAITFISEKDQQKFKAIEDFIEKEVKKVTLPAAIGDGPKYQPTKFQGRPSSNKRKKPFKKKFQNNKPKRNTQKENKKTE